MHVANDYYGHDLILAWAAGMRRPKPILGYVQHGWKPEVGFSRSFRVIPRVPLFVWSRSNLLATQERFPKHDVEAIGAPFLYLYRLLATSFDIQPSRDLLVYPCHSLRDFTIDDSVHLSLIEQVRGIETMGITVSLHPNEFRHEAVRALYASLPGASVTTNWLRPPLKLRHDPMILVRQIIQILSHQRVASNCLTTALFYAAFLKREARLLTHPARRRPPIEGRGLDLHRCLEVSKEGVTQRVASQELGEEYLRDPDALRRLMSWDDPVRPRLAGLIRQSTDRLAQWSSRIA
jgi:hypothetical protein